MSTIIEASEDFIKDCTSTESILERQEWLKSEIESLDISINFFREKLLELQGFKEDYEQKKAELEMALQTEWNENGEITPEYNALISSLAELEDTLKEHEDRYKTSTAEFKNAVSQKRQYEQELEKISNNTTEPTSVHPLAYQPPSDQPTSDHPPSPKSPKGFAAVFYGNKSKSPLSISIPTNKEELTLDPTLDGSPSSKTAVILSLPRLKPSISPKSQGDRKSASDNVQQSKPSSVPVLMGRDPFQKSGQGLTDHPIKKTEESKEAIDPTIRAEVESILRDIGTGVDPIPFFTEKQLDTWIKMKEEGNALQASSIVSRPLQPYEPTQPRRKYRRRHQVGYRP